MNYLPIALIAYTLNAVAVTIDKFLITKKIPDPLVYVFYFSLISLVVLPVVPFVAKPDPLTFVTASAYIFLWVIGAYFMLKGLKIGQVARVIPIIGTLIPIFLLIEAVLTSSINFYQIIAVLLLTSGLVFLTIFDWKGKIIKQELVYEIVSAFFFASAYIILRQAYLMSNFMTVLVYSHLALIPLGLVLLFIPATRKIIFPQRSEESQKVPYWKSFFKSKTSLIFGIGQVSAGISELLLTYSVSLATPALVNSLQGTQYVFLFGLNLVLAKTNPAVFSEDLSPKVLLSKLLGIIVIGTGLYLLAFGSLN